MMPPGTDAADSPSDSTSLVSQPSQRNSLWFVYLAFLFPALAGFLFGYDIGTASGAVASLSALSNATNATQLTTLEVSIFTSASLFGATLGSILAFWIGQPLGRRRELILGSTLYLLGSLVSGLGPGDAATVVSGRAVYGFGIAFCMHAAPVYISEMAPAAQRGLLVSLKEGFIVLGVLCGFAATACAEHFLAAAEVYRTVWTPAALVGVLIAVGMSQMPPSPRWLMLRDSVALLPKQPTRGRELAAAALRRFRRGASEAEIEAEIEEIEATLAEAAGGGGGGGGCREILRARRALVAGLGLVVLQQLTGQPSVLYYQVSGGHSHFDLTWSSGGHSHFDLTWSAAA